MVECKLVYTRQAQKDAKRISKAGLKDKVIQLTKIISKNPFQNPPPFEKLLGDLTGACSRRINFHHRLIYQVLKDDHVIKIIRLWTHYE